VMEFPMNTTRGWFGTGAGSWALAARN